MQTLITRHEIDDAHVDRLATLMQQSGWDGPAILVDGDEIIDGHHRYVAALALGIDPMIEEIRDVFEANGLDYDALMDDYGHLESVLTELPTSVRNAYDLWV